MDHFSLFITVQHEYTFRAECDWNGAICIDENNVIERFSQISEYQTAQYTEYKENFNVPAHEYHVLVRMMKEISQIDILNEMLLK